ncbi:MAG TPA: TIR domain-containing protein [Chitinophagaceae bacterium]
MPVCYGNAGQLNEQLQSSIRIAEDILNFAAKKKIVDPLSFLKKLFKPDFDFSQLEEKVKNADQPKVNLDVFFQIDEYIKSKTKQVTPKMLNVYRNMRDTLKSFENYRKKSITFESFDFNFYEEFVEYMMYEHVQRRRKELIKGFRISTVGKTIKRLRIFLRNRMRRKIIAPINLDDFKILDEESDSVYLTWDEIIRIYQIDLSAYPHLCKYRALFVFGCLYTGIISNLKQIGISSENILKFTKDFRKIQEVKPSKIEEVKLKFEKAQPRIKLNSKKVFVVHGRDGKSRLELCNLLKDEFKLEPIVLQEKPNNSIETIISKFERLASECSAAIILFTPDDESGENKRARQNVIFELGYFLGKFHDENNRRIIILKKGNIEIPSDISGILYLEYDKAIKEAYYDLKKQLDHWGY